MALHGPPFFSAAQTARAIRSKQISPVDVVQAYLNRIEQLDATLHAYITVCGDEARLPHGRRNKPLMRGESASPLFGVPVAVKDQFWTRGILTTNGSRGVPGICARYRCNGGCPPGTGGAILLGKLNLSELAMGGTRNRRGGSTQSVVPRAHPRRVQFGIRVALAAHLCAAPVGEDTGGSGADRRPTAVVVGLRPTFTRVSRYGMTPMCWFTDAAAPMTKTVEDCALVLGAIAGYDPQDPTTSRQPVPDYTAKLGQGIDGIRVGLIRELYEHDDMHPEVRQAIAAALEVLRAQGAEVGEYPFPSCPQAGAIFVGVGDTEGAGARDEILRTRPAGSRPRFAYAFAGGGAGAGENLKLRHESPGVAQTTIYVGIRSCRCARLRHLTVSTPLAHRFDGTFCRYR